MKTYSFLFVFGLTLLFTAFTDNEIQAPIYEPTLASETYDRAVLLLHNFEYEDASELFIAAQQKDPDFTLAYWGEAMTYDHPVWGDLDIDKSRAALKKLGDTPEIRQSKCKTGMERDLVQSVEILFGEGSKPDRQKKYSEFMATLYQKYPGNNEITAFYSLSLLGVKKSWSEWESHNVEAARLATEILKRDPNHPGALHYLVHANDHPQHANDGLDAANRYSVAASYAGHALHMPSHIYLALGMWDDVVKSNEISWKASVDRKEKKQLDNDKYSYHSHLWLQYGYLQQGRFARAKELLENQTRFTNEKPSAQARVHLLQMKGHYLIETQDWNSPIADLVIKTDDIMTGSQYNSMLLQGYKAFKGNDKATLTKVIAGLEEKLASDSQVQKANENMTICGVTRFVNTIPTTQEIQGGQKQLKKLQALHAWLDNDVKKADDLFKESLPKEGAGVIGPPFFLLPAYEIYGDFLLAQNKPSEAFDQYGKSLLASPNRIVALKGQLKAAKLMNDKRKEVEVRKILEARLKNAEPAAKSDI
jgi:tetratricopeptide (TPR) repeat protein